MIKMKTENCIDKLIGVIDMPSCPKCAGRFVGFTKRDENSGLCVCKTCGSCFAVVAENGNLKLKNQKWNTGQ